MDKVGLETLKIMNTVNWYNNWLYSFVKDELVNPVLEVGSGIGNFTKLIKNDHDLTSMDKDTSYIRDLKKKYGKEVVLGKGDIEKGKYFFKKKKFSSVVIMNVLEHIKKDFLALANINELLIKNGKLIVLVPAYSFAYGELDRGLGHKRRYSKQDLVRKLDENGFIIEEVRYLNTLAIFGWFFNARVLKRKIIPKMQLEIFNYLARPILLLEKYVKFPFGLSLLAVAVKK